MTSLIDSAMPQDNRPVSIRHHRYVYTIAHSWTWLPFRQSTGWLTTTCGLFFAPNQYEFLPEGSYVTCMTCLVVRNS